MDSLLQRARAAVSHQENLWYILRGCKILLIFLMDYFIFYPVIFPVIILILVLLRPFILIRVSHFRTDAIGHTAKNYEMYLCEKDAGMHPPKTLDLFFNRNSFVCNQQLSKMWKEKIRVSRWAYYMYKAVIMVPCLKQHHFETVAWDKHGIIHQSKRHLYFNKEEEERGGRALKKMGIYGEDYICVYARDEAYKQSVDPNRDWSYHDYNNVDIYTYKLAINELASQGYYVLRVGSCVKQKLNISHPKFIDYATNGERTDFLDIYLPDKCYFFVSNGSGLEEVAVVFRKPILFVNIIPLEHINAESDRYLAIFKKLWIKKEKRFMKFREIIESGVGGYLHTKNYVNAELEIINNTPEEINDAMIEMRERLRGTWKTTEEDEELQRLFWSSFKTSDKHKIFLTRIGKKFLDQNRELLE